MFLLSGRIGPRQVIQRKNMTKRVSFLQMFSQYSPPAPLDELLAQAAIQNAELDISRRCMMYAVWRCFPISQRVRFAKWSRRS